MLQASNHDIFVQASKMDRLTIVSTFEDMYKMACSSEKKYAVFQGEEMYKVNREIICHLINVGKPYTKAGVTSGIVRNFKYKRTIDLG